MKILLLGEFSGFYKNLKEGLVELGHEVDTISSGDSWKAIGDNTYRLFSRHENKYVRYLESRILEIINFNKLVNYDVIQIINPKIFGLRFGRNIKLLRKLKKNNRKLFMSVAGDDYYVCSIGGKLRYSYFSEFENVYSHYFKNRSIANDKEIIKLVDGIIPIMYTYAEAYRFSKKILKTIPLPLNFEKIKFSQQEIKDQKVKIFHGVNREEAKGTKYIREAMEKLKENYPNDVEILIDGKMPLKDYLKVLEETNIVVDQALSYEYGMNALYSMAMGKVVLSGNEPECGKEFGRADIPVINIEPSVEDIYDKLEKLVQNKQSIIEIGKKSRLFVEDFHHHVKVAQQYIDVWNSGEVNK